MLLANHPASQIRFLSTLLGAIFSFVLLPVIQRDNSTQAIVGHNKKREKRGRERKHLRALRHSTFSPLPLKCNADQIKLENEIVYPPYFSRYFFKLYDMLEITVLTSCSS